MGMVVLLHSSHCQVLISFTTILHSTWHIFPKEPPVQANTLQVVAHSGKDMTSTKEVMMGYKWSTLPSCQDNSHDLQVDRESHHQQHHQDTIH